MKNLIYLLSKIPFCTPNLKSAVVLPESAVVLPESAVVLPTERMCDFYQNKRSEYFYVFD